MFSRAQEEVDVDSCSDFVGPTETFDVYYDASLMGLGGVLMHNWKVVAYASR